jgi:plasmid stability protein
MPSITLKNIPEHLHRTYKRRAKRHARSLQAEILHTLGQCAEEYGDDTMLTVEEVAGCIKPARTHVTLAELESGVDAMFLDQWKSKQ